jgi:flagellar protein FliS
MSGLQAYQDIAITSRAMGVNAYEFTGLFFEKALSDIKIARTALQNTDITTKCERLSNACKIIELLHAELKPDADPEFYKKLDETYSYLQLQISLANLKNDDKILDECEKILTNLSRWWKVVEKAAVS